MVIASATTTPCARASSTTSASCRAFSVMAFSHSTCLPACTAAFIQAWWESCGEAM